MKDVKFLKDHGSFKKGDEASYHKSTAKALSAHKVVEITGDTKVVEVTKDKIKQKVHDIKNK